MPFWKKKQKNAAPASHVEDGSTPFVKTLIGPGWRLKGRIYGKGQVVFQSRFEGEVDIQGCMTVDPPATVKGMFHAEEIHIYGTLEGGLEGSRTVALEKSARVDGDVTTPRLQMDTGARLNGKISMENTGTTLKGQRK
jgi:cytoskeletal protein CcmA (bactofilin family)